MTYDYCYYCNNYKYSYSYYIIYYNYVDQINDLQTIKYW